MIQLGWGVNCRVQGKHSRDNDWNRILEDDRNWYGGCRDSEVGGGDLPMKSFVYNVKGLALR